MIHEVHDLLHELPEHAERIRMLQAHDESFRQDLEAYDLLDRDIQEAEMRGTPLDDIHFEWLKKRRLALKDVLFSRICMATV
ncbi:MAG: DUF465 domain-containing protein [Rhodospirillaceae bacterium]|nr:DUF465 domain-containing protein [Rhodospirillaceae bacterium]